jgi:hypothetical protein
MAESYTIYHLLCIGELQAHAETPKQLNHLIKIMEHFTPDKRMAFGLRKCRMLNIRHGTIVLEGFETQQIEIIEPMDKRYIQMSWYTTI